MVGRPVDVKKIVSLWLAGVVLVAGLVAVVVARHWPLSQERVTHSLQSTFPATVKFQKFHSTYFPHPGCIAEGVVFTRLGATAGTPPVVTIQRLTVRAHYLDLFVRPGYLAGIVLEGFRVHIPPLGTPVEESNWRNPRRVRGLAKSSPMIPHCKLTAHRLTNRCSSSSIPCASIPFPTNDRLRSRSLCIFLCRPATFERKGNSVRGITPTQDKLPSQVNTHFRMQTSGCSPA